MEDEDVYKVKVRNTSTCCKDIQFLSAPKSLYANVQGKYFAVGAPRELYGFAYQLSAVPDEDLDVQVWLKDIPNGMSVLPAQGLKRFTSSTPDSGEGRVGAFIFEGLSTHEGNYTVVLNVSGPGSAQYGIGLQEYTAPQHSFVFLSELDPPAPPSIVSARFSYMGLSLNIMLDRVSDKRKAMG